MRRKLMSGLTALVLLFTMATPAFAAAADTGDPTADPGLKVSVTADKSSLPAAAGTVNCTIKVQNTSGTTVNNGSVTVVLEGPGTADNTSWTGQEFKAGASKEYALTISLPENTTDADQNTVVNITVNGDELQAPVSGSGTLTHKAPVTDPDPDGSQSPDPNPDNSQNPDPNPDNSQNPGDGSGTGTPPADDPGANPDGEVGSASLTVTQSLNDDSTARNNVSVKAGDKVYWNFTFTNTSKIALNNCVVTAVFPANAGISYRANSVAAGTAPHFTGNQCVWSIPDLDVGEHVQLSVVGEVSDKASAATFSSANKDFLFTGYGYYPNAEGKQTVVNVSYDSGFTMAVTADAATVSISPAIRVNDAQAASTASSVKVQSEDKLTYEITVKNTGKVDAKNVVVKAEVSNDLTLDEKSIDTTVGNPKVVKGTSTTVITWTLESLEGEASKVLKFSGTAPKAGKDGAELKTTVSAVWDNKAADSNAVTATTSAIVAAAEEPATPRLDVTAVSVSTGNQNLPQASTAEIKATVRYDGLTVGEEYSLVCTLYDVDTGKPLTISNGNISGWVYTDEVIKIDGINGMTYTGGWSYQGGSTATTASQSQTFKASATYGGVDVKFSVNSTKLAGKRVAVVAQIKSGTTVIGTSTVPAVGALTTASVTVPTVSSTLAGPDKTQNVAVKSNASVVATVNCGALVSGNKYRVVATLVDANGQAITGTNGQAITVTDEFTANAAAMNRTVTLNLDTSKMSGKTLRVSTVLYNVNNSTASQLASATSTTAVTVKTVASVQTGVTNGMIPVMIAFAVCCFAGAGCLGVYVYRRREDVSDR